MKILLSFLLGFFLFAAAGDAPAQNVTVILLRHAEKDASPGADKVDPDLSEAGRARAQRLVEVLKKYEPTDVFSSDFRRTRLTAAPLAEKRKIGVRIYDHKKLGEIYDSIMKSDRRTIVVVGHNTTTPALVNMLVKQEKYKPLDESEYGKIWVVKIRKGKIEEKIIEY